MLCAGGGLRPEQSWLLTIRKASPLSLLWAWLRPPRKEWSQDGLIGKPAMLRQVDALRERGLRVRWNGKRAQATGVGGRATVIGVIEAPMGIAGVNGLLEMTVVQEDIPMLLPIKLLRQLTWTSRCWCSRSTMPRPASTISLQGMLLWMSWRLHLRVGASLGKLQLLSCRPSSLP